MTRADASVRRRLLLMGIGGACLVGGLTGCTSEPTALPAEEPSSLSVAVVVPMTGPNAQSGRGAVAAIDDVFNDRRSELEAVGLTVELEVLDDRGQQSVGQQEVTTVADDGRAIALIGSVSSIVDEGLQPIANQSGLPMVSLGGVDPELTRRTDGERPFNRYVTLAARDSDRAALAAEVARRSGTTLAVVRGERDIDRSMTAVFAERAKRDGATVAVQRALDPDPDDESVDTGPTLKDAWLADLRQSRPAAVYLAIDEPRIWPTIADIREALPRVPIVLDEPAVGRWSTTLDEAEAEATSNEVAWGPIFVTTTGADAEVADLWPSPAATTVPRDSTATPDEPRPEVSDLLPEGRYAAAAHDAAEAVVDALLASADEASGVNGELSTLEVARAAVSRSLAEATVNSAVGPITFDASGVASHRGLGVFERVESQWVGREAWAASGACDDGDRCRLVRVVGPRS